MMRQYGAQRRQGGANPLGVGVIAVGSSYYLQDDAYFRDRYAGAPVCRVPWQVEAFTNGLLHAARRNRDTGAWEDTYWSGRSEMAVVRSLHDGQRRTVAVRLLVLHDDLGLTQGVTAYPSLPDLRLVSQYSVAAVGHRGCCGGDPACGSGPRACGRDWDPPQLLPPG